MVEDPARRHDLRCPVCGASFRGSARCPRCGADLSTLMQAVAAAWRSRNHAAARLARRDFALSEAAARASTALHATAHGRRLACLAGLLRAAAQREAADALTASGRP